MVTTFNQVGESTPFTVTYLPELLCTYVNIILCTTHTTYFLTLLYTVLYSVLYVYTVYMYVHYSVLFHFI